MKTLWIGDVPIAVESADKISQSYEPIGGMTTLRTMRGAAVRQRTWSKLRTVIQVPAARLPVALQAIDLDAPHVIQCLAPRAVAAATRSIALPTARRADVAPWGVAVLPSGFSQRVAGALSGNTLTLDAVPGALRYTAYYVPQFAALITEFSEQTDVRGALVSWQITAEEI